jgi:galactonate dehydratase
MRIEKVEAFAIRAPRDLSGATGLAGSPTKLKGGADYRWSEAYPALYSIHFETALIRVTLDSGVTGWGEAQAPLAPQVACTIVETLLAPVLIGEEFSGAGEELEALWSRMYSTMRVRGQTGGFMLDAISGIDLALWDLAGKITNKSSSAGAAERPEKIAAYLSGLAGETPSAKVENAKPYVGAGFEIIKLYFDRTPKDLLDTMDALQSAFRNVRIAVDGLWRFSFDEAVAFGQELDARRARWFECPLLPEFIEEHAMLAREIQTPLAAGESYRTRFELREFFKSRSLGVVQPDLGRSGLTEGLRIAETARKHGMEIVPHVSIACGPQIAAAIHFARLCGNCNLLEYNPRVFEIANRFLNVPLRMEEASYLVPEGPGLGIEMNGTFERYLA